MRTHFDGGEEAGADVVNFFLLLLPPLASEVAAAVILPLESTISMFTNFSHKLRDATLYFMHVCK